MTVLIRSLDGGLSASFEPDLGMLCSSLVRDGEELLDQRQGLKAYRERGKTMAIPLLYPWANRLSRREFVVAGESISLPEPGSEIGADENGLPIHGVMPRLMRWDAGSDGDHVSGELHWQGDELLDVFPFAHSVLYEARLQDGGLKIAVTVRADAGARVPVSFGFHPYLRLPVPERAEAFLQLPDSQRMLTDERGIPTGACERLGPASVQLSENGWDDGLALAQAPSRFALSGGGHSLQGFPYGQIFSPEQAGFACIEPMTAATDALISGEGLRVLDPGGQLRAAFAINAR